MKQKFQQRKTRRGWETSTSWKMAVAGVVLAAGLGQGVVAAAQGPSAAVTISAADEPQGPQAGNATNREFHIVAGPLTAAIDAFHEATGLRVKFKVPAGELAGFHTAGVQGTYTDAAALRHILDKTGLSFVFEGSNAVEIAVRSSESVDVTAATASVALQQFTEPLLDTAQTVNVVPQFIMQEQAATSLRDGLRNVPGISLAAGENGAQGDNLTVRGFTARNDIYLDGIRDFGSYYRDSFDFEAIEVLQGPAGVEFGRGSTGGVVNQETKTPRLQEHVSGTAQVGTNALRRGTVDVNEPLKGIPGGAAFRVNAVGMQSNVTERDVAKVNRYGVAPSLAFGLNTHTRAIVNYLHEWEDSTPDYGLPYLGAAPAKVPRNLYYGYRTENFLRTSPDVVTGRVEHDFARGYTVRSSLRWGNYPRNWRITEPQINSTPVYTQNATTKLVTATCSPTAATPCFNVNTDPSLVLVRRSELNGVSTEDILWNQMSLLGQAKVAGIGNNFVVIAEGGRERSRPQRLTYSTTIFTPLLAPNANDVLPAATAVGARTYVNSASFGLGFIDTVKLRDWLLLSGGVRFDYFDTSSAAAGTVTQFHTDGMPSYRASIVVKPRPAGSVYFDWGTSFNPAAESLSLSANNATQNPQTNETYETGVKWAFFKDRLNLTSSYFQVTKDNVYETDPNNSSNVIPVGDQRVRGAQIGLLGHMPRNFDLILGYAYLNGRIIGSIANYSPFAAYYKPGDAVFGQAPYFVSAQGNPFANVPKNSFNAWVTHSLHWGFVGGFGVNEVSARRASSTGPTAIPLSNVATPVTQLPVVFKVIPGYWNFNAMLRRPINDHVDFQANVNNLTNAFFIDQPHPNHLIPGEGLNAQFGFNYKF